MRLSRSEIVGSDQFVHLIFRCLNKEFLFKDSKVKEYILKIWEKYKSRYNIDIYEFILMDNHVHILVKAKDSQSLANFMRICNSLIAKKVNRIYDRIGHALQERYQSPAIENSSYFENTAAYIWLNRYKVNQLDPRDDIFCSLYYRIKDIKMKVLDDYPNEIFIGKYKSAIEWLKDLINAALEDLLDLKSSVFAHSHSIGSFVFQNRINRLKIV